VCSETADSPVSVICRDIICNEIRRIHMHTLMFRALIHAQLRTNTLIQDVLYLDEGLHRFHTNVGILNLTSPADGGCKVTVMNGTYLRESWLTKFGE
jgi:hypothetical protein